MKIESPEELLVNIAAVLEKLKIRYFVTGGFAVSVWGRPRATFDIDIVIQLIERQVNDLIKALRALSKASYIDEDMARQAIKSKREFNFIDASTGLKIDFIVGPDDEFTRLKFQRRKSKTISGQKVYFISPEDLILSKLLWYQESLSSRQLEDVESIIKISGENLDWHYLEQWARQLEVWGTLRGLREKM
ncbi:MAG: hypothetical protein A3A16_01710 [Candidatus Harrisonbacteria bacterium RIFCSPLOWO2_01_FULL_44_18]|uniref:Nucleotidyl transferase AbiEii/AbiGii toxin family protein n=1 Tax=Candidatus Harrisonbacteria bacterium RIFCSPLOWO2_01_FULL_44_18 TaxID=1798407 RepID=A0A1G1ZMD3_9BACT|nr:MAG: hypothetical protein A3A16_01710 [Candidatus Harrisonbacteria bacterium RIFCSPLOWO2_01_FULL_44_18]